MSVFAQVVFSSTTVVSLLKIWIFFVQTPLKTILKTRSISIGSKSYIPSLDRFKVITAASRCVWPKTRWNEK